MRSWRGATRAEDAETYLEYLERTGLAAYREAVFYPEDDRFLVERDTHVDHYEVVHRSGVEARQGA